MVNANVMYRVVRLMSWKVDQVNTIRSLLNTLNKAFSKEERAL